MWNPLFFRKIWGEKIFAFGACFLVLIGLALIDLWIIFNPAKLKAITEKQISNLFQSSSKVHGFYFNFSDQLTLGSIEIVQEKKYSIQMQNVSIAHHPWLAYLGLYYPQRMEIGSVACEWKYPQWKTEEQFLFFRHLHPYLKKLKDIRIQSINLQMFAGGVFESAHYYILDFFQISYTPEGFRAEGFQRNLDLKNPLVSWENFNIYFACDLKKNHAHLQIGVSNFHLQKKSWGFLPAPFYQLCNETRMDGILDIQLKNSYSNNSSIFSGDIRGYNISFRFLEKELTKGEIFINFNLGEIQMEISNGLFEKREIFCKGKISWKASEFRFRGQNKKRSFKFVDQSLSSLLLKICEASCE